MKNNPTLTLVVMAALFDDADRVFVQRRSVDRLGGGKWEFPGGKIEAGEAPAAALVRELAEELCITVAPGDLAPLMFGSHAYPDTELLLLLYRCKRWSGTIACLPEVADAMAWLPPEQLYDIDLLKADVPLIPALMRAVAE